MRQTRGKWKPAIKEGKVKPQDGYDMPRHWHNIRRTTDPLEHVYAPLDWPKPKHHTEHHHPEPRKSRKGFPYA